MKEFIFRVTQSLIGYYEGEVSIKANSEDDAREKLKKLPSEELEEKCTNWEQADDMNGVGPIKIQELQDEEDEEDD